jgi:hypothetical protein
LPRAMITVEHEGFRKLSRKVGDRHLLGAPMKQAFTRLGKLGSGMARQRSPVGASGRLASSVKYRVPARPFPKYVTIRANATRKRVRYGYILDVGRFRRGRAQVELRRRGTRQPTRAWFTGIRPRLAGRARGEVRNAARQIENRWRR